MSTEVGLHQFETVLLIVNVLNIILTISSAASILLIIREYQKSLFAKALICFLTGIAHFGIIQIFFMLLTLAIIQADPSIVSFIWHTVFYFGIVMFFYGTRSLSGLTSYDDSLVSDRILIMSAASSIAIASTLVLGANQIQTIITLFLQGDQLFQLGIYPYLALLLSLGLLYYMSQIKDKIQGFFSVFATPLLYGVVGICFIHIFELSAENWQILPMDYNVTEGIEIWLWLPIFICINYAFWKLYITTVSKHKAL